ncbi:hypothetical protein [Arthrobacter sp. U41]|uniref:hypothetical protein n=1 Tax=Arthrobacter sp. U41 TaxID=1849032 RepID=UPI000859466F|nr:hypothetical protein [Arthrobacter sp. U41]AOT03004.1 hypothetical protein ASPU41_06260 [Arthrobacter sp. U41]
MGKIITVLIVGLLATVLAGCGPTPGTSDTDYAAKYKAAVQPLAHVARVDASYKSSGGIGRSGDVFLHADTADRETMMGLLRDAFPAIVDAAAGDPEANPAIQVISADGASAVSPTDLGYSGTGSLTSYRQFLGK